MHLPLQLTKPKRGEALLRGQRCPVRAKGACLPLGPQRGDVPSSSSSALRCGTVETLVPAWPSRVGAAAARPPHGPLPSSRAPAPVAASSPSPLALRGQLPHHWAQQSAGWSSFQSCHFFFISDFTCHGGGESGGFSLAVPSLQTKLARGGMAKPPAEAGLSPSAGQEKLQRVRTSLLAKQYSTATRKPWRESRGVSPQHHPLSWGWDGLSLPRSFLGAFGAEVPLPLLPQRAQEAPSRTQQQGWGWESRCPPP